MTIAEEKGDFSRRLKEAMRKARLDAGPTRFAREFNLRHHGEPVTAQTGEPERAHTTAKQDTATYAVDSAWLGKKFDSLSEPHRKMVLEITRALLRLEGKQ